MAGQVYDGYNQLAAQGIFIGNHGGCTTATVYLLHFSFRKSVTWNRCCFFKNYTKMPFRS